MVGNSKVALTWNSWPTTLIASLDGMRAGGVRWYMLPEFAESGQPFSYFLPLLPALLAGWTKPAPTHILVNLYAIPMETWAAELADFVDQVHAKWPYARVYVTRTWNMNNVPDNDAQAALTAGVCATRSTYCLLGDDERVWMEGGDGGATMTVDGVHYSAAGQAAAAVAKQTVLGY